MQRPDNERGTDKERLTILIYRYTEYKVHTHTTEQLSQGIPFDSFGGAQDIAPRPYPSVGLRTFSPGPTAQAWKSLLETSITI